MLKRNNNKILIPSPQILKKDLLITNLAEKIVTEVTPAVTFYSAEQYHQDYFSENPNQGYCSVVVAPKVAKFSQKYAHLLDE